MTTHTDFFLMEGKRMIPELSLSEAELMAKHLHWPSDGSEETKVAAMTRAFRAVPDYKERHEKWRAENS